MPSGSYGSGPTGCFCTAGAAGRHGDPLAAPDDRCWPSGRPWPRPALVLVAADAFLIEPHWLEVSHRRIASPKIHHPVRIVVLADLQCNNLGQYERDVLRRALDEKPDILLLAGDYSKSPGRSKRLSGGNCTTCCGRSGFGTHAKVFAVGGNVDPADWADIFTGLNVTAVAAQQSFDLGELQLTCLGLGDSCDRRWRWPTRRRSGSTWCWGTCRILRWERSRPICWWPGTPTAARCGCRGSGRLITLSRVPRGWAAGLTELPGGGKLLVSRGIGMERGYAPPMRFLCRPELVVIDLVPEGQETTGKTWKATGEGGRERGDESVSTPVLFCPSPFTHLSSPLASPLWL